MDVRSVAVPLDMGRWELRIQEWRVGDGTTPHNVHLRGDPWVKIDSAWYKSDPPVYIGDQEMARHIVDNLGIVPEYRTPTSNVATIGYCDLEQRWFGWSHRAMCGFAIGDKINAGDVVNEHAPDAWIVGRIIHTLEEAREAACVYAEAVS